jgi:hypothetical protein
MDAEKRTQAVREHRMRDVFIVSYKETLDAQESSVGEVIVQVCWIQIFQVEK